MFGKTGTDNMLSTYVKTRFLVKYEWKVWAKLLSCNKYKSYETDQTLALPLSLSTHATSPPPSLLSVLFSVTSSFPQVSPPPL